MNEPIFFSTNLKTGSEIGREGSPQMPKKWQIYAITWVLLILNMLKHWFTVNLMKDSLKNNDVFFSSLCYHQGLVAFFPSYHPQKAAKNWVALGTWWRRNHLESFEWGEFIHLEDKWCIVIIIVTKLSKRSSHLPKNSWINHISPPVSTCWLVQKSCESIVYTYICSSSHYLPFEV